MACELTTGMTFDCSEGVGGIDTLYIAKLSDFATGVTVDGTTGEVDALPEATLFKYDLKSKLASSFTEELSNDQTGSYFYNLTVNAQFKKLSQAKQKELHLLAKNRVVVFVKDRNNTIWMLGRQYGLWLSGRSGASGQEFGDFNGYSLVFTGEEPNPAPSLEAYTTTPFDNFADITLSATQITD
jgi:hypothetical protein